MILLITQEKIITGYFSKLTTIRSLSYYLICGYEFKSYYKSCGYSSTRGTRRFNSIAKNGCKFKKISLNWIRFWKFMAFRMLRKQATATVHHGKTTFLTLGLLLYSHQKGRQHSTHTQYQGCSSERQGQYQGCSSERQGLLTRYVWIIDSYQALMFIYGQIRRWYAQV